MLNVAIFAIIFSCGLTSAMSAVPSNLILNLISRFDVYENNVFLVQFSISISAFAACVMSIFFSYYQKWHGKTILLLGLVIFAICGSLGGMLSNLYLFIASRICIGFGCSMIFAGGLHIMRHILPVSEYGQFFAWNGTFISLNTIFASYFCNLIRQLGLKWEYSFLYYAVAFLPFLLVLKFVHHPNNHCQPPVSIKNDESMNDSFVDYIRFCCAILLIFTLTCTYNIIQFNGPLLINENKLSHNLIPLFFTAYSITSIPISFVVGNLMKYVKYQNIAIIGILLATLSCFSFSRANDAYSIIGSMTLCGISAGFSFIVFTPLVQSMLSKQKIKFTTNMSTAIIYLGFGSAAIVSNIIRTNSLNIYQMFHTTTALLLIVIFFVISIFTLVKKQ